MEMKILDKFQTMNRIGCDAIRWDGRQEGDDKSKITNRPSASAALGGKIMNLHSCTLSQPYTRTMRTLYYKSNRCKQSNVSNQLVSHPAKAH